MKLNPTERDYYVLSITTNPELSGTWEASFDGGTTWVVGVLDVPSGDWSWLIAGPDFDATAVGMDPMDTAATIETSVQPKLRIKDDPVLDVEHGPTIRLTST